jgi:hypothetical protein
VKARDEKEKQEAAAAMAPADKSAPKTASDKTTETAEPKKPPTLLRPGEKKPPQ